MYDIISVLNPEWAKRRDEQQKRLWQQRRDTATFTDWRDDIKWEQQLNIKATSYPRYSIFKVKPCALPNPNTAKRYQYVDSPNKTFRYIEYCWNYAQPMQTWYGSRIGDVMFDGEVVIPALYERDRYSKGWDREPWMSLTPAEIISLRGGTRRAKGRTVVAGLGLGHQLIEVARRKQVKEIVLVEKSQELVDWLMPHLVQHIEQPLEIIVGDAMQELPKLVADVALVDIFKGYGSNDYEIRQLRETCFTIRHVWGWGTANVRSSLW